MRMVCLFKHLQLILVEVLVNLGNLEAFLFNNLDGTWHLRFLMLTKDNFAKSTSTKWLNHSVLLCEIVDLLECLL